MRIVTAYLIAPFMAVTGKRFSKHHRQNETLTYRLVDTIAANLIASAINPIWRP